MAESQIVDDMQNLVINGWELLEDYINALPNGGELNKYKTHVMYQGTAQEHEIRIEKLHSIIVHAITCNLYNDGSKVNKFLTNIYKQIQILPINKEQICGISDCLSFERNGLDVAVKISNSLKNLFCKAANKEQYQQQGDGHIKISIDSESNKAASVLPQLSTVTQHKVATFCCQVTDMQAILALVFTVKCYPEEWKKLFFWDAWLAVTIQLDLLRRNHLNNTDNDVLPCLWLQNIFLAERLVNCADNVKCLLMGQDPVSSVTNSSLRGATGVAFHNIGDDNASIQGMTKQYKLDCTGVKPKQHCEKGILLVNMIRCIQKNSKSMDGNLFYDAWFVYTLKLSEYFGSKNIPVVVMCNKKYQPNLVQYITQLNHPNTRRIEHPGYKPTNDDIEIFQKFVLNCFDRYVHDTSTLQLNTEEEKGSSSVSSKTKLKSSDEDSSQQKSTFLQRPENSLSEEDSDHDDENSLSEEDSNYDDDNINFIDPEGRADISIPEDRELTDARELSYDTETKQILGMLYAREVDRGRITNDDVD